MRVLVTGARGFIGSRVVSRLAASTDLEVLAGRRDRGAEAGPVRVVPADVLDRAALDRALDGVDAVVHTAYGDERVTVEGTRTVLDAAARAGARRVVHLSSIAVYGRASGTVTEDTPFATDAHGYGAWKIAAEQAALTADVPVVRLRPTIVYGPGSELWIDGPLRKLRSGRWGTFGPLGEGTCNPVHVDDVAAAVEAALRVDLAGTPEALGAFNVNGPETLSWNDWFRRISAGAGLGVPREIPPGAVRRRTLAAVPLKVAQRVLPSFDPAFLDGVPARSERELFALRATYPTDAARRALGWAPRIGLDAGLADTWGARR